MIVSLGCGASFILMMIPPTSARKVVRLKNATIISELSSLYALLTSAWITEEEAEEGNADADAQPKPTTGATTATAAPSVDETDLEKNTSATTPSPPPPKWALEFRRRLIPLAAQLQALRAQTATAKWEGNLRGAWPVEE